MGSDLNSHRPWLAFALEESLRRAIFSAKDIMVHASPEVLVAELPHQVISEMLSRALASGTFSAASVIETAPPALLAEYLSPDLIWRCLQDAADRAGITKKGSPRTAAAKQWLAEVLKRGLDTEFITPADVLRFLPPGEFVGAAPLAVVAELIKNGLMRGTFDPVMVLQHLTPTVIAESLETALAWGCISDAIGRKFDLETTMHTPPPVVERMPPIAAPSAAPVATAAPPPPSPRRQRGELRPRRRGAAPPARERAQGRLDAAARVEVRSTTSTCSRRRRSPRDRPPRVDPGLM